MRAIVYREYGPPDVLRLEDVEKPVAGDGEALVRVRAASVNPYDWHMLRGTPYLVRLQGGALKPKRRIPGLDLAGQVEAVGGSVTRFRPGDEVFGMRSGALAEHVCVREEGVLLTKPANLTYEQAAAVPLAALTALQGLRDKGRIRSGHEVLINGASGGIGTFAVQTARSLGARVTGVCSTGNADLVRSLGADHIVDCTQEDFTRSGQRYDVILDLVGNRPLSACRQALRPEGTYVAVAGGKGLWVGPLVHLVKILVLSRTGSRKLIPMLTKNSRDDLAALKKLLEGGEIKPVVDRQYLLGEAPAALRYLGAGHARRKIVVTL